MVAVVLGLVGLVGCAGPDAEEPATSGKAAYVADPTCNPWIDPDCQPDRLPEPCIGDSCNPVPHCPAMACWGRITSDCRCVPPTRPICYVGCPAGQTQNDDCSCSGPNPWNPDPWSF